MIGNKIGTAGRLSLLICLYIWLFIYFFGSSFCIVAVIKELFDGLAGFANRFLGCLGEGSEISFLFLIFLEILKEIIEIIG